ncbi:uncharacterized protein LOC103718873 [Phoenix dactylifera]|uniref:Uncharacterized protein LOC103718873 n=1 Tax=Phoenix dactylifera TaxID=42345 RepID=A0A8B7CTA6_PHODC|nr:uncharacterized protein LOC103718873 [Phoenix dactylifera]
MDSQTLGGDLSKGRPVGGTEFSWCQAVPGGTGITVLAIFLSRPVSLPALQSALQSLQTSHPILSAVLAAADTPQPLLSIPSSPPPLRLRRLPAADLIAALPSASHLHSLLEHELNQNPWSDPADETGVFFATLYELPEPGRSVLALRFHTAVCDRTAGVAVLKELLDRLGGDSGNSGKGKEEGIILGIEDLIPKKDAWKPFWARGRDLVGYSMNGLRASTLRFDDAGSDRASRVVRLVLSLEETQGLLTACKAREVKLCAAMSAAALVAAHSSQHFESNQQRSYMVATLIDSRKYLKPVLHDNNIGFYHSGIINSYAVHGGEDLWELANRCQSAYSNAMKNKKHLTDIGELNFLMCKAIQNPHLTPASSLRTALISVFDEPVISESSELQQYLGVEDYVGCSSVHGVGPSIAFFDTIRDGQLDCACVYPSPLHSNKQIQELVEHMKGILIEGSHVKVEELKHPQREQ